VVVRVDDNLDLSLLDLVLKRFEDFFDKFLWAIFEFEFWGYLSLFNLHLLDLVRVVKLKDLG
jgi:hypothetical protein